MAITLNDNIKINAGKPIDNKYLSPLNTAYSSISAVNTAIPIGERYLGLTVNINNVEYWYKDGVTDINLVEKKYNTVIPEGDYITGGTNIGYFSGKTGIQTLPINHLVENDFDGNYESLYNSYYRDVNGIIQVGIPSDGIERRGYVKSTGLIKSWIWNEYTGSSNMLGWILIDGNIKNLIGTFQSNGVPLYYNGTSTFPYTNSGWTSGVAYNNTSGVVIGTVLGSLTTGDTLTIGGRPFAYSDHNNLHFKTIVSNSPNLNVSDDSTFIYLSATTSPYVSQNVGTGVAIYSGFSNNTFYFKTIVGSGDTYVSTSGNNVVIFSSGGSGSSGYYNLSSPSVITVGGIPSGTILTGKTSNELFERLLVPTLYPVLTSPSTTINISHNGVMEIGTTIPSIVVTANFNRGCISPQYNASSDKRSVGACAYCFIGSQITSCVQDLANSHCEAVVNYQVCEGNQTWSVKTHHLAGVQPYDSKGNLYCSALPVGVTNTDSATIIGILPWYYGLSSSMIIDGTCIAGRGRDGLGRKIVEDVTNEPILLNYCGTANDYIWFALPACADTKTSWCVSGANIGLIGGIGNLFAAHCAVNVSSAEGCWSNCSYNVYVSCHKTAVESAMYIR